MKKLLCRAARLLWEILMETGRGAAPVMVPGVTVGEERAAGCIPVL